MWVQVSVDLFKAPLMYNNKKHILVSPATLLCVFSDCYVADELVVSRAGRRVRVGNTDAEGRMVMVDLLCEMKEKVGDVNPLTDLSFPLSHLLQM